jgi:hypothetical protein
MNRSYTLFWVILVTVAVPQVTNAHPPGVFPPGTFGSGPTWLGFFPHIHQHGPLYNYGPYYGYPPFEPYGPWTANLQYNPAYAGMYSHFGRVAEDKSGHGGLFTQGNGGGLGLGTGLGFSLGGGWGNGRTGFLRDATCSPRGGILGLGLLRHRNTTPACSSCTASPSQDKTAANPGAAPSSPSK